MWGWGNHDRIFIVRWTNSIKWRRFEQPRLFLDWPSSQTEQLGKKDLDMSSRPITWWSHWMSSRDHVWRWEKLLEWQPSLEQWFGLYGRVATWRHQKDCEKQDSLVWWTSFSSVMSRENQSLLTTCTIPSQWGSKVSSSRVWGTVRIEEKSWMQLNSATSLMNTQDPRPFSRTMTLSTQLGQCKSGLGRTL